MVNIIYHKELSDEDLELQWMIYCEDVGLIEKEHSLEVHWNGIIIVPKTFKKFKDRDAVYRHYLGQNPYK